MRPAREAVARALDALADLVDGWARAAAGVQADRLTVAAAHARMAAAELREMGV
jgi:hypothetical protein